MFKNKSVTLIRVGAAMLAAPLCTVQFWLIFLVTPTNGAANIIKYRKDRCSKHLAAPTLSGRPVSIHWWSKQKRK